MRSLRPTNIRTRLALWYVAILAFTLTVYIAAVFAFQYVQLEWQIFHDEIQDVETVEGLLFFDPQNQLHLQDNYYSHPQSRLLVDRLMEVRDLPGTVLYRSDTLHGMPLGGASIPGEGGDSYNQRSIRLGDGTRVLLISHLHPINGRMVLIRLGYTMAPLEDRMMRFFFILLLATPVGLVAAGFAGSSIARRALLPLAAMAARAEQITVSNLHDRIVVEDPQDELGHMGRVLNHLLARLEQAFSQLQRFTADAAHELRTPLAALRSTGEITLHEPRNEARYREAIGNMLEETGRLDQTIDGLLLLSRAEAAHSGIMSTPFLLQDIVDEILLLLEVLIDERHLVIRQEEEQVFASGLLHADRSLIRVALLNVLHNAIKFSPDGSTIRIFYSRGEHDGRVFQGVCIHDSGPGIAPGEHGRVFERFFTSTASQTAAHSGAGLGLSIARLIVERNGGRIFFDEEAVHGAKCCIEFPLS